VHISVTATSASKFPYSNYEEETKIDVWQHTVISVYFDMTAVPVFADLSLLSPCYPPSVITFHLFFFLRSVQQWLQPTACHVFLLQNTAWF